MASSILDTIRVLGSDVRLPRGEDFAACEAAMGIRLPASYKAFAQRFGYGLLAEIFLVYVPQIGVCDSLERRSQAIRETMAYCLEHDIAEFELPVRRVMGPPGEVFRRVMGPPRFAG